MADFPNFALFAPLEKRKKFAGGQEKGPFVFWPQNPGEAASRGWKVRR